ncbi:MAG: prolyl oligopeptidase family serine peptidase [Gemmatimonadota bacterium]|nr:prolyl oligopeptidase family serine peptidase [Gemmatimonadota bacterium]
MRKALIIAASLACLIPVCAAGQALETPIRQTAGVASEASATLTLRDASRDDRWLGLAPRDVRWAPDGSAIYFRWNVRPGVDDVAEADPWYRADRDGRRAERVEDPTEIMRIPAAAIEWAPQGRAAAWSTGSTLFVWDGADTRPAVTLEQVIRSPRFYAPGVIDFVAGEALYRYSVVDGSLAIIARRTIREEPKATAAGDWLVEQQRDLFAHIRDRDQRREAVAEALRQGVVTQAIPLPADQRVDDIMLSPDGRYVTFRSRTRATNRPPTEYVDYVDESGYATVRSARAKTGEPRDIVELGIVRLDPRVPVDSLEVAWVTLAEAADQNTVPHGPYWSPDGRRALVQFIGEDHRDVWFAELDVERGAATVITHDHDDAWIGGPPVQANYLQPALLEWLDDGRWVFASERSGWSHLYAVDESGTVAPLTSGEWEVRAAALAPDRASWLLQTSREHPSDDHLYRMADGGGPLIPLTRGEGRNEGWLSPDGERLALIRSTATNLPDLFLDPMDGEAPHPITESGTESFRALTLAEPEIVSFPHPDGDLIWAALYTPDTPLPDRPAVIHVHGGGYRQFAHRGWSVYGWALHVGFLNYLVQQGFTVLDFDYRGGAGFGRDYRADIARSMGLKDADGVAAAAEWLARERGIDSTRIGMHGVSYGGFLTLMTLFRHPGIVTAGIARASVTDWAHYSDGWTSRILGVPHEDPEAYERSSPIYWADGLEDHLLLTHGIVDDNVHFQDAVRLVQKLIELEKEFEVMYYPVEPHTIETEPSRYDFVRRAMDFFEKHLVGDR